MSRGKNKRKAAMRRKRLRRIKFVDSIGYVTRGMELSEEDWKQLGEYFSEYRAEFLAKHQFVLPKIASEFQGSLPDVKIDLDPDPYRVVYYGLPQPFAASLIGGQKEKK